MKQLLDHKSPLKDILERGSLLDIIRLCGQGSPAFLAAVVKAHTLRQSRQSRQAKLAFSSTLDD